MTFSRDRRLFRVGEELRGFVILKDSRLRDIEGYLFGELGVHTEMCQSVRKKNEARIDFYCGVFSHGIAQNVKLITADDIELRLSTENWEDNRLAFKQENDDGKGLEYLPPDSSTFDLPFVDFVAFQMTWLTLQNQAESNIFLKMSEHQNYLRNASTLPILQGLDMKDAQSKDVFCQILSEREGKMKWNDLKMTSLSCFPGSGSEFLQTLLAEATALPISKFDDFLPLTETRRNPFLVVKGHHQRAEFCQIGRKGSFEYPMSREH